MPQLSLAVTTAPDSDKALSDVLNNMEIHLQFRSLSVNIGSAFYHVHVDQIETPITVSGVAIYQPRPNRRAVVFASRDRFDRLTFHVATNKDEHGHLYFDPSLDALEAETAVRRAIAHITEA